MLFFSCSEQARCNTKAERSRISPARAPVPLFSPLRHTHTRSAIRGEFVRREVQLKVLRSVALAQFDQATGTFEFSKRRPSAVHMCAKARRPSQQCSNRRHNKLMMSICSV